MAVLSGTVLVWSLPDLAGIVQAGTIGEAAIASLVAWNSAIAWLADAAPYGRISTATLTREIVARGGSRQTASRAFANDARKRFGATTAKKCVHIERQEMRQDHAAKSTVSNEFP